MGVYVEEIQYEMWTGANDIYFEPMHMMMPEPLREFLNSGGRAYDPYNRGRTRCYNERQNFFREQVEDYVQTEFAVKSYKKRQTKEEVSEFQFIQFETEEMEEDDEQFWKAKHDCEQAFYKDKGRYPTREDLPERFQIDEDRIRQRRANAHFHLGKVEMHW